MDQYIDIRTSYGQYQWYRLGSLVNNEVELGLDSFQFLTYLTAGAEWDYKHLKMQKRLEDQQVDEMVDRLIQQEQFDAAYAPQVAEDFNLLSGMQVDDNDVEEELANMMSETQTYGEAPNQSDSSESDPG
ncbi:uncharacterized protein ColSpa_03185 [Colletotrichum spaethianum]|uniref:Uncharacterized protein n=1 Tax=Colletotrichum spaethianum TaxID=700344 RepID=A0AA37LAG1_9PEZI|nr:uncharacterized protein ColSpa_03185 [Colletotrichum spaethianum]GKT43004.1 hypothetical protein ColSpa_03185 [Colletotrichum spaethianum]